LNIKTHREERKTGPKPAVTIRVASPHHVDSWLQTLCKEADIRLNDGTFPTIQNFRQFWKIHYKDAVHKNLEVMDFVSDEAGTDTAGTDTQRCQGEEQRRQHIRDLGREFFDDVLDLSELPALVQEELDQNEYINRQSEFGDFGTDIGSG